MESITVGIDLAKQVFSVCVMDGRGRVIQRVKQRPILSTCQRPIFSTFGVCWDWFFRFLKR